MNLFGSTTEDLLLRTTMATFVAIIGGVVGAVLSKAAARQINALVYSAMGILLLVTVFDVLPDAKSELPWGVFLLATGSGFLLFWLIGKYVYHICPSCALHTFDNAALQRLGQTITLFMIALGVHSTMDGLAVVVGDDLAGKANIPVLLAVTLHKLPEGMALALLMIGSGYARGRAILWTVLIESTTELGGLFGVFFLRGLPIDVLAIVFAHVGGGFLYLVGSTLNSVRELRPHATHQNG